MSNGRFAKALQRSTSVPCSQSAYGRLDELSGVLVLVAVEDEGHCASDEAFDDKVRKL